MFSPDKPIHDPREDVLGRKRLSKKIAELIGKTGDGESIVLGIEGPWGSGKSSLINLIISELGDEVKVMQFNPWFFTDESSLIRNFFDELRDVTASQSTKIGRTVMQYGGKIAGGAQIGLPWGFSVGMNSAATSESSLSTLRVKVEKEMKGLKKKIVIIIDDIDRLTSEEVRSVFKLVKLTASFSNTFFLLAYDKEKVQEQLTSDKFNGAEYLKKIIQISFSLPEADRQDLNNLLTNRLDKVLEGIYGADFPFDKDRWRTLFWEGLFPLFQNIRDINIFISSLQLNWSIVGKSDVNIVDFIGIEAIRVFAPSFYRDISTNKSLFLGGASIFTLSSKANRLEHEKALFEEMLSSIDTSIRSSIRNIAQQLFPRLFVDERTAPDHLDDWRKSLRVCSEEKFDFYFKLDVPTGSISEKEIEAFLASAASESSVADSLLVLSGEGKAKKILQRLTDYTKGIDVAQAENIVLGIWSVGEKVKIERSGMLDLNDYETLATRIAYWMIRDSTANQAERISLTQKVVTETKNIEQATTFIYLLLREHEPNDREREPLIEDVESLKTLSTSLGRAIATYFLEDRDMIGKKGPFLLYRWREWGDATSLTTYLETASSSVLNVAKFLTMFAHTVFSTAGDYRNISRKDVAVFIPEEKVMELINTATTTELEALTDGQREAIDLFKNPPDNFGRRV